MPYYNRDQKRDYNFENHPCGGLRFHVAAKPPKLQIRSSPASRDARGRSANETSFTLIIFYTVYGLIARMGVGQCWSRNQQNYKRNHCKESLLNALRTSMLRSETGFSLFKEEKGLLASIQ